MKKGKLGRPAAVALLAVIAAASIATQLTWLPDDPQSTIFFDEFHYAQYARDVAHGDWPLYNRSRRGIFPPLYGVVLAPVYALAGPDGFPWWSRVANALLLASTILPVYRLARRSVPRGWAVAAAAGSMLGAYHYYALQLMSENLLVPLTTWFVYLTVCTATKPRARTAIATGAVIGAMTLTKTLSVYAWPAAAVTVGALATGRRWSSVGWLTLAAALPLALFYSRAWWDPTTPAVLPSYSTYAADITKAGLRPVAEYAKFFRGNVSLLLLGPGAAILALSIAGLLHGFRGSASRRERALAVVVTLSLLAIVAQAALFLTQMAAAGDNQWLYRWVYERYFCPLYPTLTVLFVIALAHRPAMWRIAVGIATTIALAAWMPRMLVNPKIIAGGIGIGLPSFPSTWQGTVFGSWFGTIGARVALASPLLLLWPAVRGRRWAIGTLIMTVVLYLGHGQVRAMREGVRLQTNFAVATEPMIEWLATHVDRDDMIVFDLHGDRCYAAAMHFGMDFCRSRDVVSGARRVGPTAAFEFDIPRVPGTVWLLSEQPWPLLAPRVSRLGALRLFRVRDVRWLR